MDNISEKNEKTTQESRHKNQFSLINDDSVENQNKGHNIKKEALGPNTRRKR